jgi:ABC-type transport system involved in multi-copper enzyme maturation permease subunit
MRFAKVLSTEFRKLRRAGITWVTFAAYGILPMVGGLFTYILKDPEGAKRLGLLGQKASFAAASADWPGYLGFLGSMAAVGGMLLVSVIVTYLFGREYADNTAKNMLALPVPRAWFPLAKLAVAGAWFAGLTIWFPWTIVPLVSGLAGPAAGRLPAGSYVVVALTCAAGTAAALLYLKRADNTQ